MSKDLAHMLHGPDRHCWPLRALAVCLPLSLSLSLLSLFLSLACAMFAMFLTALYDS